MTPFFNTSGRLIPVWKGASTPSFSGFPEIQRSILGILLDKQGKTSRHFSLFLPSDPLVWPDNSGWNSVQISIIMQNIPETVLFSSIRSSRWRFYQKGTVSVLLPFASHWLPFLRITFFLINRYSETVLNWFKNNVISIFRSQISRSIGKMLYL